MSDGAQRYRVTVVLGLLVLVLAAGVAWQWYRGQALVEARVAEAKAPVEPARSAGADQAVPTLTYEIPPLDALGETAERPLFYRNRRPPEQEPKAKPEPSKQKKPAPKAPPPQLTLTGVVMFGEEPAALLKSKAGNEVLYLRQGEKFEQWRLAEIQSDRVVFSDGDRRHEILLRPPREAAPSGREEGRKRNDSPNTEQPAPAKPAKDKKTEG